MCTRALYCVVYVYFTPGVSSIWVYISLSSSFMWKHCVYLKRISDPPTAICLKVSFHGNVQQLSIKKSEFNPYHVWAQGRRSVDRSSRWIWNFWVPFIPSRKAKPCSGTLDVPVTNCRKRARSAWSKDRSARQNH